MVILFILILVCALLIVAISKGVPKPKTLTDKFLTELYEVLTIKRLIRNEIEFIRHPSGRGYEFQYRGTIITVWEWVHVNLDVISYNVNIDGTATDARIIAKKIYELVKDYYTAPF